MECAAGVIDVARDLRLQRIGAGEFLFCTQPLHERYPQRAPVEIRTLVEQMHLERERRAASSVCPARAKGRVDSEIRRAEHGRTSDFVWFVHEGRRCGRALLRLHERVVCRSHELRANRVDAHRGEQLSVGPEVRSRPAERAAATGSAHDTALEIETAAEQLCGSVDAAREDELAHLARGDNESVNGDLRQHVQAHSALLEIAAQRGDVARAGAAVGEVGANQNSRGPGAREQLDEGVGIERRERAIKRLLDELVNRGAREQLPLARARADERRGHRWSEQSRGVRLEGERADWPSHAVARLLARGVEERAMAAVDTVEVTDRDDAVRELGSGCRQPEVYAHAAAADMGTRPGLSNRSAAKQMVRASTATPRADLAPRGSLRSGYLAACLRALKTFAFCALLLGSSRLYANNLVDARLLAEPASASAGEPFTVAIRLRVPEGWHISWRNPGDAGLVPTLQWELPAGVAASAIQWPAPHALEQGPIVSYVLDGEVWLLVDLVPARALPVDHPLAINVMANWLVCKDLCIPEEARLSLTLPVAQTQAVPSTDATGFALARTRLPRALGWSATLTQGEQATHAVTLRIDTGELAVSNARARFFPYEREAIEPAALQPLERSAHGLSLVLTRPRAAVGELKRLSGVLVLQGNDALDTVAAEVSTALPTATSAELPLVPAWLALFCAFAGGMLLNLMPCVLPVLGFKVLSLVRDASRGERRSHIGGLAYSAGVVASFWALAIALFALRAGGQQLGWGFQLQFPTVVALLALLYFAIALSFLGVASFGSSLQTAAGAVRFSSSAWGAFGSGVLATAVATPCTAPFMGVALGAALVARPLVAFGIFTGLGVGMAWPYALLTFWPALLSRIPRPGPWLARLQQLLSFPLFATVLWLLSVLAAQTSSARVFVSLGAMLLIALALWAWRLGSKPDALPKRRASAQGAALLLIALSVATTVRPSLLGGSGLASLSAREHAASTGDGVSEVAWVDWSEERVAQLRAEGRTVFIDFTASWCLSCQLNERVVFSSREVRERFAAKGVVLLRADWTRADPAITRALEGFGRSGVPLNVLLGPKQGPPIVLPAVLTPGIVLDALTRLP